MAEAGSPASRAALRLGRLTAPRSIAFIGGADAAEAVRVCKRFGFEGAVWPVSPSRAEMHGVKSFRDLSALPEPPDAAFIGVNRFASAEIAAELAAMGAGGAVAYASGFSEVEGRVAEAGALERGLVEAAGEMPLLGPNCYGLINAAIGASIWPSEHGSARAASGVAIISQSTNMAISMTMQRRGLPVSFVGTVGNQAQTGLSELGLAALAMPTVTALGLYIEGLDDAAAFEALAAEARRLGKPIAALKSGVSEQARAANLSHTASLSGADHSASALFRRLGVARVETISGFLETLKLFHVHGAVAGQGDEGAEPTAEMTVMACSGGDAAMAADAAERAGVRLPALSNEQSAAVAATVNALVTPANPLDFHTFIWGDAPRMTETFSAMMEADAALSLLVLDWVRSDRCSEADWLPTIEALLAAQKRTGARAAVAASLGENMPEDLAERLVAAGVAPFSSLEDAMVAASAAGLVARAWAAPAPPPLVPAPPASAEGGGQLLDEAAAKAALAAFGAPVPEGVTTDLPGVERAAKALGAPVAVKALGIAHKTEARAVALGLAPADAAAAAEDMAARLGASRFLVEAMAPPPAAELIVGVTRDAPYGLTLTLGAGGVLAELLGDVATLLLPASVAEIRAALLSLKTAPLLTGYRGRPAADIDAAAKAAAAIAAYAAAHADTLIELDVNPLLVSPAPGGAIAVDALIRLEAPATERQGR